LFLRAGLAINLSIIVFTIAVVKNAACGQEAAGSHQVPLLDDCVIVRIPVRMFNQTLYFVLDTGTSVSALDLSFREKLGPPISEIVDGMSVALGKKLTLYRCPDFSVDDTHGNLQRIACLDLTMFRRVSGERCDGILGMDFLANYVISLDFDRFVLAISDQVPEAIKRESASSPLLTRSMKNWVAVEAVLNLIIPAKLMIDTGDNSSMSLNQEDWNSVFPGGKGKNMHSSEASMMGGKIITVSIARIDSLEIGSDCYDHVLCALNPMPGTPSGVGLAFLRRHRVTLDFPNRRLYLARGRHFSDADEPDMSGLHLIREGDQTLVYSVDAGSPAAAVGIKAGDVLLSINSENVVPMKMKDMRQRFKTKDGDKVTIELTRRAETRRVIVTLKKSL
jgi:hypothetical protein